jgi:hypothetical protein
MSLQHLSAHVASQGRGKDTALVHMTPGEVAGLNAIARKAGYDGLTTNPETGLPEAGILSSILPVVAGFFLGPAGLGMSTMGAAATVGGVSALASGSLAKGLQAGFGAWGGAGLGGALTAGGVGEVAATQAMQEAGAQQAVQGVGAAQTAEIAAQQAAQQTAGAQAAQAAAQAANPLATAQQGVMGGSEFLGGMNEPTLLQQAAGAAATPSPQQAAGALMNGVDGRLAAGTMTSPLNPAAGARTPFAMGNDHASVFRDNLDKFSLEPLTNDPMKFLKENSNYALAAGSALMGAGEQDKMPKPDPGMIRPYTFSRKPTGARRTPGGGEPLYFQDSYTAQTPYSADQYRFAEGGVTSAPQGMVYDPVTQMYTVQTGMDPTQGMRGAVATSLPRFTYDPVLQRYTEIEGYDTSTPLSGGGGNTDFGGGGGDAGPGGMGMNDGSISGFNAIAAIGESIGGGPSAAPGGTDGSPASNDGGGIAGSNSSEGGNNAAGGIIKAKERGGLRALQQGRHLKGPGDGMSDDIPATIEGKQPARLAADEFVVPADVVSHLGNGSSDAGAKQLYAMMDRVRAARTGRSKQAPAVNARKMMPA